MLLAEGCLDVASRDIPWLLILIHIIPLRSGATLVLPFSYPPRYHMRSRYQDWIQPKSPEQSESLLSSGTSE